MAEIYKLIFWPSYLVLPFLLGCLFLVVRKFGALSLLALGIAVATRVVADITQPDVIHAILEHRTQRHPTADTARAPPVKAPVRKVSVANTDSLTA